MNPHLGIPYQAPEWRNNEEGSGVPQGPLRGAPGQPLHSEEQLGEGLKESRPNQ